jgi:hypothetical protein
LVSPFTPFPQGEGYTLRMFEKRVLLRRIFGPSERK